LNIKQISGLIACAAGISLIVFAVHSMQEIAETKGFIHDVENFFTHNPMWNPIVTFFGGKAQEKVAEYDLPVFLSLIGGIVLTIAGAVITIVCRRTKQH